jgi:hypothetical protein
LVVFDGKIVKNSLSVTKISSFIDKTESDRSGLIISDDFALGKWNGEMSIMYMEFIADSLDSISSKNNGTDTALHSFTLNFKINAEKSTSYDSRYLEIGYCEKKSSNEYIDTSRFVPISRVLLSDTTVEYAVPISKKFLFDTTTVLDTAASLDEYILDTAFTYSYKNHIIINTTSSHKNGSFISDSVSTVASIVKNDSLLYDTTIQFVNQDTTVIIDTVKTVKQTVSYRFDKILQHNIVNQDTTDTIFYDTTQYTKSIVRKTYVQHTRIFPNMTINTHVSDPVQLGINDDNTTVRYISFYARLHGESDTSLLFLSKPDLNLIYVDNKNDTTSDTISYSLRPSFYDYSVFELDTLLSDTVPVTSGAAGRFVVFEIDITSFWGSINGNNGKISFKNIPKADLTVYPEFLKIHKSVSNNNTTPFKFCFLNYYTENIEDLPSYRISTSIDNTTGNVVIPLENYFLNILNGPSQSPKGYLYIWINRYYYSQIKWKKADKFPFEYVVLNSR